MIVHTLDRRPSVLWRSLVAIDPASFSGIAHLPNPPSIVALLAPVTRRFAASPIVHLAPSHVVRASRVLLSSLVHPAPGTITPDVHLDRVLLTLACEILRECTDAGDLCDEDGSMEARLRALLHERHTDPELDVAQLARELHVSRRQLYRHAQEGEGIAALIASQRYQTARVTARSHHRRSRAARRILDLRAPARSVPRPRRRHPERASPAQWRSAPSRLGRPSRTAPHRTELTAPLPAPSRLCRDQEVSCLPGASRRGLRKLILSDGGDRYAAVAGEAPDGGRIGIRAPASSRAGDDLRRPGQFRAVVASGCTGGIPDRRA